MKFKIQHTLFLFLLSIILISCKSLGTLPYSNTSASYAKDFQKYLEPNAKLLKSWYHYTVELSKDRKYILKSYYPEKKAMTSRVEYSDSGLTIMDGKYASYNDEGKIRNEGFYSKNKRTGKWKTYRIEMGIVQEEGEYILGNKEGLWTVYDSLGAVYATYIFEDNKKNGPYQVFKNGELYESGKFLDGDVVNTKMVTDETESVFSSTNLKVLEKMPRYPGCETETNDEKRKTCAQNKMLQFIYNNIQYPPKARQLGVEGVAVVRFLVQEDGSINDIEAIRGICAPIASECLRVVKLMPKWIPGEQGNEPVPVYFNLPVKFKLE